MLVVLGLGGQFDLLPVDILALGDLNSLVSFKSCVAVSATVPALICGAFKVPQKLIKQA